MATITITPGNSFTATETVTSTKLNDLGSPTAALTAASIGTADIANDAITPALIADNAVTTPAILDANVTFAKLTDVIDDDTMATATDTTLATSESIKAYVDGGFTPSTYAGEESVTLPNGLIMKFGQVAPASRSQHSGEYLLSFASSFPNAIITATSSILITSGYPDNHAFVDDLAVSGIRLVSGSTVNATSTFGWTWTAFGY